MEINDIQELSAIVRLNDADLIQRLQTTRLLPQTIQCCQTVCSLRKQQASLLGHCFWCSQCEERHSVLRGTFFETCGASVREVLLLLFLWVINIVVNSAAMMVGCSEAVALQCFQRFRDMCSWHLLQQKVLILFGGEGHFIQIDELVINRSNKWVLGIYNVSTQRVHFVPIPNRSAETLETIISQHILPGSEIFTDHWEGYNGLMTLGGVSPYTHRIDPQIGASTNYIAKQWMCLKQFLKYFEATESPFLSEYLDQFVWWRAFGPKGKDRFREITAQIAARYPVE